MAAHRLTPDALADLDEIWRFIARDDPEAADRVEETILAACKSLSQFPRQGHSRPDLTKLPVLFWTVPRYPSYLVIYRPETKPLQIIRVLHGRRDLKRVPMR